MYRNVKVWEKGEKRKEYEPEIRGNYLFASEEMPDQTETFEGKAETRRQTSLSDSRRSSRLIHRPICIVYLLVEPISRTVPSLEQERPGKNHSPCRAKDAQ